MTDEKLQALIDYWYSDSKTRVRPPDLGTAKGANLFEELFADFMAIAKTFQQYRKDTYFESSGEYYRRMKHESGE